MSFFSDVERELVVVDRRPLSESVVALELTSSTGRPLPVWEPGAHVDLQVSPGVERQYSLCGDPHDRSRWRVAVLREPEGRGGSVAAHRIEVGQLLRARGPRTNFHFESPAEGAVVTFVAGGIGITPILPMVGAAAAAGAGADWTLHYAGRSLTSMAYAEDLVADHGTARVRLHPSDQGVRIDLAAVVAGRGGGPIWACGPARLLEALDATCTAEPEGVLHVERFTPRELPPPVWHGPFEVELAASGDVVTVPPQASVLEALEEHGVVTVSSCRTGTCGTCETVVLEGEVDHRDSVLTPSEQALNMSMMPCVSRAACPRVVLDA